MGIRNTIFLIWLCSFTALMFPKDESGLLDLSLGKTVYIIPPLGYQNEKLFDMDDPLFNRDDCMRPFYTLRQSLRDLGYDLKTTLLEEDLKDFAALIVCGVPYDQEAVQKMAYYPKQKIILVILEPPAIVPHYYDLISHAHFGKIYIMLDDWIDNVHYFKLYYPQTTLRILDPIVPFDQKKFCTLIAGNHDSNQPFELYSERKKIIHFFENYAPHNFEFYGHGWHKEQNPCYSGSVFSKIETLKNYKFCICYENTHSIKGYITEKIFDTLLSGCVPIYWGAENVCDYINTECFIWRESFKNDQELYDFLISISADKYQEYIKAAKNYLDSDRAHYFSQEHFVKIMIEACLS